jgi:UDP-N-acetylmuramate--alanine ligase
MAKNIKLENGFYAFDAVSGEKSVPIKLSVPGYHNIYNALATIALASHYNIKLDTIKNSLLDFTGAHRRFEFVGYLNGAKIYDDYAHHPTEIKALISAANELKTNKLWVVFQPHTYSRTYTLFDEFASCFKDADSVILTSIYAAREKDTGLVSSKILCEAINKVKDNCIYIETFEDIEKYLKDNVKPNDIVLTVGAGSITKLGYEIKE